MTFRILAALAAVFVLAACGGGGGGGKAANIGGPSGPGNGGSAGAATISKVAAGDALIVAQGSFIRVNTRCRGTVCTMSALGESVTLDFNDYIDPNTVPVPITDQQIRNGVRIGRVAVTDDGLRFDTYGIWGNYNAATTAVGSGRLQGIGLNFAFPVSMGVGSGSNPVSGNATWTGAMVGVKVGGSSLGAEVTGDAEMTANLAASSLDLAFTGIAERGSGTTSPEIRWQGISMRNGSFSGSGRLQGRFYGSNHEEAGGVFERSGIAGAFSLARQ